MRMVQRMACCCRAKVEPSVKELEVALVKECHSCCPGSRQRAKRSPRCCPRWMYSVAPSRGLRLVIALCSKATSNSELEPPKPHSSDITTTPETRTDLQKFRKNKGNDG